MMIVFGFRNVDRDVPLPRAHGNLMRVAEVHNQILALLSDGVTNALNAPAPSLKPSVTPTTML